MKLPLVFVVAAALLAIVHCDDAEIETKMCEDDDTKCNAKLALKYVNMVRIAGGKGPLEMGSVDMLKNAMDHSKKMKADGKGLYHQPIREGVTLSVGSSCELKLSAENVAMFMNSRVKNPAAKCVKQWRESSGHYRNIMADNVNTIIGIYVAPDKTTWCTQTFSRTPARGSCAITNTSDASTPARTEPTPAVPAPKEEKPTPAPKAEPTPDPKSPEPVKPAQAKTLHFDKVTGMTVSGQEKGIVQKCSGDECMYCVSGGTRCINGASSLWLDSVFKAIGLW